MEDISIWHFPISEHLSFPDFSGGGTQISSNPPVSLRANEDLSLLPSLTWNSHLGTAALPLGANSCLPEQQTHPGGFLCAGDVPAACS